MDETETVVEEVSPKKGPLNRSQKRAASRPVKGGGLVRVRPFSGGGKLR